MKSKNCYYFALLATCLSICSIQAQTGVMNDNRDGKIYKTIQIGSQTWMAENLSFVTSLSYTWDDTIRSGIYCYNDDTVKCNKYGMMYTLDAALKACPLGWHLPTKMEFESLLSFSGKNKRAAYKALRNNGSAGFNGTLGGLYSGRFFNAGLLGLFWSSTNQDNIDKYYYFVINKFLGRCSILATSKTYGSKNSYSQITFAHSVRCIKDN